MGARPLSGYGYALDAGGEALAKQFSDPGFRGTIVTTVIFTLATTAISVSLGWVLAMLCAFAPRQTAPFRVMIFMAFGISETVSGYMWISMLRPDQGGLLNAVIGTAIPGFSHAWLGDENDRRDSIDRFYSCSGFLVGI